MKKILFLLFCSVSAFANVSLPSILNSNMVLQQQTELVLWGWADPTEKITVSASWASAPVSTTCADNAVWKVSLQTPKAGGPYTITINGRNKVEFTNIPIGATLEHAEAIRAFERAYHAASPWLDTKPELPR